jgi:hypothetical protein
MTLDEKLRVAWKRVKEDRKTDFIIGDFEYAAFEAHKDDLLSHLATRIRSEGKDFTPAELRLIRVPKPSFTTRPGAIPEVDDRVFFQYLVDEVADAVESTLVPVTKAVLHSYRYSGKRNATDMFLHKRASYSTFDKRTRAIAESSKFIVTTDVASYFEHLYHHELDTVLRALGAPADVVDSLTGLLRRWAKGVSYGLPQGLWPSDYLGNVYLDPIDKFMVRSGYPYCRFVDDIRAGVDSLVDGQRCLLRLEKELGRLGLTLNAAKTHIVPAEQIERIVSPHTVRLSQLFDELREESVSFDPYGESEDLDISEDEILQEAVHRMLTEQLAADDPDPHTCRFVLKLLRTMKDDAMVGQVIANLSKLVVASPSVVNYLLAAARRGKNRKKVVASLSNFVYRRRTCYDWQLMWLLHALARAGASKAALGRVRKLLMENGGLHEAVKVNAILLLGDQGDASDRNWLLGRYDEERSVWVRRAILVAVRALPASKRNHFYQYCRGADLLTDKLIQSLTAS